MKIEFFAIYIYLFLNRQRVGQEKKLTMIQNTNFIESETTDDQDATKTIKNNVYSKQN